MNPTIKYENLLTSHKELLRFAQAVQVVYQGTGPLSLQGLFELYYHLDPDHPESVAQMLKRAVEAQEMSFTMESGQVVYVLVISTDFEGDDIRGVFSDRAQAETCRDRIVKQGGELPACQDFHIYVMSLDPVYG